MNELAIVMCTYNRVNRLPQTIKELSCQKSTQPHLYIWNNNQEQKESVQVAADKADFPVTIYNSPDNVGGFGRFIYASKLTDKYPYVVFIDDDVSLADDSLAVLISEARPLTISSFYAFRFNNPADYWDRTAGQPGQTVNYCGTGGMIADSSIFGQSALFECPEEFKFIEDLWLSYVAQHLLGWKLLKSAAPIKLTQSDGQDQWLKMKDKKSEFLRYLVGQGWKL